MAARQPRVEQRGSDSPLVAHVRQVTFAEDWAGATTPDGCWDLVVREVTGGVEVLQTGVITRPVELAYRAGERYLQIAFKPGVFMPRLPGDRMVDRGILRPMESRRTFLLDRERLAVPTFEDAEGLVERLARLELLVRDGLVEAVIAGTLRTDAPRTVDVAVDLGYADQPHMARSLKRFMGRTPGEIVSAVRAT